MRPGLLITIYTRSINHAHKPLDVLPLPHIWQRLSIRRVRYPLARVSGPRCGQIAKSVLALGSFDSAAAASSRKAEGQPKPATLLATSTTTPMNSSTKISAS
jgi:hypothetical protein